MIYTDNWLIQSIVLKKQINKNCLVKIDNGDEKIFINVIHIKQNGDIVGNITKVLTKEKTYKVDDLVYFKKKHVIDILTLDERKEKAKNLIPDLAAMCKVFIDDFYKVHGRVPIKQETDDFFENHVNIL